MKITVKYKNNNYTLDFNTVPSISQLKKEILNKTQVDPKFQRIIFQGNVISQLPSNSKISKANIKEGSRLLLLSSYKNEETTIQHHARTTRKQSKIPSLDTKDLCLNQEIIELGPPPGCEKGAKNIISKFPKDPFIIYDSKGNLSQMAIEQDSFWINQVVEEGNKGEQDRLFYSDITDSKIVDIEGYKNQYCAIVLLIKKFDAYFETKVLYFIPYQYSKAFKDILKERQV